MKKDKSFILAFLLVGQGVLLLCCPAFAKNIEQMSMSTTGGASGSDCIFQTLQAVATFESSHHLILNGVCTTLIISAASIVLGTVLGILICKICTSGSQSIKTFVKAYVSLMRAVPVVVVVVIAFYVLVSPLSFNVVLIVCIGFSLSLSAHLSEIFRMGLDSVHEAQMDAALSNGFTEKQAYRYVVMPQVLRRIAPSYQERIAGTFKMAAVVGYSSVHDITNFYGPVTGDCCPGFLPLMIISVGYFAVCWLIGSMLNRVEFFPDAPKRGRKGAAS